MRNRIVNGLIASLLAIGGITAAVVTAGPAMASSQFKIVNLSAGGCWKDQGLNHQFTTSPCATASNFSYWNGTSQVKDGSGNCATVSAKQIVAGNCVMGVTTQELQMTLVGPGNYQQYLYMEWNALNDGYFIRKATASPYPVDVDSNNGDNVWCLTSFAGCNS